MSKKVSDMTIEVCKKVVERAEETGNCGICSGDFDGHEANCPYPEAKEVLVALGLSEEE